MSIRDLIDSNTQNEEWSKLYSHSYTLTNLTIDGNAVINGTNFTTPGIGSSGDILKTDGTGLTSWGVNNSHSVSFGGSMLLLPKYLTINGDPLSTTTAVANYSNLHTIPVTSTLKAISYSSDVGAVGTVIDVYKNGVSVHTSNFTGASGIISLSISYSTGDTMRIALSAVDAGGTTMTAFFN